MPGHARLSWNALSGFYIQTDRDILLGQAILLELDFYLGLAILELDIYLFRLDNFLNWDI